MGKLSKEKSNDHFSENSNFLRVERIEMLMEREGYELNKHSKKGNKNSNTFADDIDVLPQNLSRSMNRGKITERLCKKIIDRFPEYRIQWLLGYDDIMLKREYDKIYHDRKHHTDHALYLVLDNAVREVCARENIEVPTLDNITELLFLQAQLNDFATSLMWNYVKHREHSSVWSYLDQIEK